MGFSMIWDGRTSEGAIGDAGAYDASEWQYLYATHLGNGLEKANRGVMRGVLDELEVEPSSPTAMNVAVQLGAAFVQGIPFFHDTLSEGVLSISANASGSTRNDIIILRADYTLQTVRLAVLEGTPAAGLPALTQTIGSIYEIPLAYLTLASGFTSVTVSMITDMREYANIPANIALDVTNSSGLTLENGNVVIWLPAGGSAVDDTTTEGNNAIAGVWERRSNNAAVGRVIVKGIFPVLCDELVAVGDFLETSTTSGQAQKARVGSGSFARVLVANTGAGTRALCFVDVPLITPVAQCRAYHNASQLVASGAACALNSERYDTAGMHDTVTNNSRITIPVAGLYIVTATLQTDTDGAVFYIRVNGATDICGISQNGSNRNDTMTTEWRFAAGDYVELVNGSGVGINVASVAARSPELTISWRSV